MKADFVSRLRGPPVAAGSLPDQDSAGAFDAIASSGPSCAHASVDGSDTSHCGCGAPVCVCGVDAPTDDSIACDGSGADREPLGVVPHDSATLMVKCSLGLAWLAVIGALEELWASFMLVLPLHANHSQNMAPAKLPQQTRSQMGKPE